VTPASGEGIPRRSVWPKLLAANLSLFFFLTLSSCWLAGASARAGAGESPVGKAPVCTRVASTGGSDRSSGSVRAPYRTLKRLVTSLRPGMVGCLRAGTYGGPSVYTDFDRSGTRSARITLRSYPGEKATLAGYIEVEGDYVNFTNLKVDNSNTFIGGSDCGGRSQSFTLSGSNIILDHDEFTASNPSLSSNGIYVEGNNEIIRFNKIHGVGTCNGHDHGIYVATSRNFRIEYNWIFDCRKGWGIQLFPNARDGRIRHNIIDGCGSGVTISDGDGDHKSSDNGIDHNLITNSVGLRGFNDGTAIAGCCAHSPDGNLVARNIFWKNAGGPFDDYVGRSYVARENVSANPRYANRAAKDFRVRASRAKNLGLWDGAAQRRR
jgi:copper-binding protein NosD